MLINYEDIVQGIREGDTPADDKEYGYAGIEGRGGQFWTWETTISETMATIEDDVTDPPQSWPREAYVNVRGIIRRNHRRVMSRPSHMFGRSI